MGDPLIGDGIGAMALFVFRNFFDRSDKEHDEEGGKGIVLIGRGNTRDLLDDGGDQEEQIGIIRELFEEEFE